MTIAIPESTTDLETDEPEASSSGILTCYARDGSFFCPHLRRKGGFTIGAKGEERVVASFADAVKHLTEMKTPRWRRPNEQGLWGIVSGIEWKPLPKPNEDEQA